MRGKVQFNDLSLESLRAKIISGKLKSSFINDQAE